MNFSHVIVKKIRIKKQNIILQCFVNGSKFVDGDVLLKFVLNFFL